MEKRIDVNIPCGTLVLEGTLEYPEQDGIFPGAVICHPHPLFGGNMHNNVVRAVRKGLLEFGYACLRFNFRGIGKSWGKYGQGIEEVQDVIAALDYLHEQPNISRNDTIVAGYSFGSWVGLKAASQDERSRFLIGVSPPLNEYDYNFLKNEVRPKLLVVGDNDFVCSKSAFTALIEQIPEPKAGIIYPGVDHFHLGNEDNLVTSITKFLKTHP